MLEGLSAAKIIAQLSALAAHGIPPAVERAVHDWAGNVGRCAVSRATLVRFDDESLAARAAQALGAATERVGPTTLVISDDEASDPEALLEKAGFPPRAVAADDAEGDDLDDAGDDPLDEDNHDDGDGDRREADGGMARRDRVAAMLDLDATSDRRSLDAAPVRELANEIRAARSGVRGTIAGGGRSGEPGAGPEQTSTAAASLSRRAATGPASIAKLLVRATQADANVVLVLTDGSDHQVSLLAPFPAAAGNSVRVRFQATGVERSISLETIASALALFGTSRRVSRNQTCPCGSARKFKRCCAASDGETSGASTWDEGAHERPIA